MGQWFGNQYVGDATNESVTGTAANEVFFGGEGDDQLFGEDGNDQVDGGVGSDRLEGGKGDDTLTDVGSIPFGFSGIIGRDTLIGGTGDDELRFNSCDTGDVADGGIGFDTLRVRFNAFGGNGGLPSGTPITFTLGPGGAASVIQVNAVNTVAVSNIERIIFFAADGADIITGGAGNDYIAGLGGDDRLFGGDGDDTIDGGTGVQDLDGGNGFDRVSFDVSGLQTGVVISTAAAVVSLGAGGTLRNFEEYDTLRTGNGADTFTINQARSVAIYSGGGADLITVGNGGSDIYAGAGDDDFTGGSGYDEVDGGDGNNTARLGGGDDQYYHESSRGLLTGSETIWGEAGNDDIYTSWGTDTVWGGADNDLVYIGGGNDLGYGGTGNDTMFGEDGSDLLYGEDGNDALNADYDPYFNTIDTAADTLYGGAGNDALTAGSGADVLYGGADDDNLSLSLFYGNPSLPDLGVDSVLGGSGTDTLSVFGPLNLVGMTAAMEVILGAVTLVKVDGVTVADARQVEALVLNAYGGGGHRVEGGALADFVRTGQGSDTILTFGGNDTVDTTFGTDTIDTGGGDDVVTGVYLGGADDVTTGAGNDRLTLLTPFLSQTVEAGIGTIAGGAGFDTLTIFGSDRGVSFDGAAVFIAGVKVADVTGFEAVVASGQNAADTLTGTSGNDTLRGNGGNDGLDGLGGNDSLDGGLNDDTVLGGGGNDSLTGSTGANLLDGGSGDDAISLVADGVADTILGGTGIDRLVLAFSYASPVTMTGNPGAGGTLSVGGVLQATLSGIEAVEGGGSSGDDVLVGGSGDDAFFAGLGNDTLRGGNGDDYLSFQAAAGAAPDRADGGAGFDQVEIANYGGGATSFTLSASAKLKIAGVTVAKVLNAEELFWYGGAADETVTAAAGDDLISLGLGANRGTGGGGADRIDLGLDAAADFVFGGNGADRLTLYGGTAAYTTGTDAAGNFVAILGGSTVVTAAGFEAVSLFGGSDSVTGDLLEGTAGDDSIFGGSGDDTMRGLAGDDYFGSAPGLDTITGGGGADTLFVFNTANGVDTFRDFTAADRLLVSPFGFGGGLVAGSPVTLVQGSAPAPAPGSTGGVFLYDTDNGRLSWDADGAGAAAAVWFATLLDAGNPAALTAGQIVVA